MRQMAPLALNGNRIIRRVAHAVGLVIADHETLLAPQEVHQYVGKTWIAVVEHADMPGPRSSLEYGRKAVHRDQHRRLAGLSPPIQFGRNPVVIRLKYLSHAGLDLIFTEPDISGNGREFAQFHDRRLRARCPVAVDGEAGIILPYDHRIERVSNQAADRARADIPGDVTFAFRFLKA